MAVTADIYGMFDFGGYSLYLSCEGTEPPTVVYMQGSITDLPSCARQQGAIPDRARREPSGLRL